MRQTLTYTPHVTLHPVESTVDQSERASGRMRRAGKNVKRKERGKRCKAEEDRFLEHCYAFITLLKLFFI